MVSEDPGLGRDSLSGGVVSSGEAPVATVQPVVLALTQFSVLRL